MNDKMAAAKRFEDLSNKFVNSAAIDAARREKYLIKKEKELKMAINRNGQEIKWGCTLPDITFIGKGRAVKDPSFEVRISLIKRTTKAKYGFDQEICLSEEMARRVSTTGYIVVGRSGNRLYFKEAGAEEGYKLSTNAAMNKKFRIRVVQRRLDITDMAGDHILRYDPLMQLYYIEKNKEEKK